MKGRPEKLIDIMEHFGENPKSLKEVGKIYGVTRLTAMRWVRVLRQHGYKVNTLPAHKKKMRID